MVIFSPYKTVISSEYINYFMKLPDTQKLTLLRYFWEMNNEVLTYFLCIKLTYTNNTITIKSIQW